MGNCVVVVRPDEVVAVETCGAFSGIRQPGCHVLGPDFGGTCFNYKTITMRVHEQEIRLETKTKDNVFVQVAVAVQVEPLREKAYEAIYKLDDPYNQVESFVADVVRGHLPKMDLDDVFEAKDEIANAVKARLSEAMEEYGYQIHQVLIKDLQPAEKVRRAMNEIDAMRRQRVAATERAEAEKLVKVKEAEAWSESKFLQGQGVAKQRQAIVDGLREAVGCGEEMDPKQVKELLLITQYFETMEKLSTGTNSTIFMPHSVGNLKSIAGEIHNGCLLDPSQQKMKK